MFTGVVAAGYVGQGFAGMQSRGTCQGLACRISCRQRLGNAAHAPRATKIESIQMDQLGIAAVCHDCGMK